MRTRLFVQMTCLALVVLVLASLSHSEAARPTANPQPTPTCTPTPTPTPLQIIYAGKLRGYFRVPSHQPRDATKGCQTGPTENNAAAKNFIDRRNSFPDAVLVGTGDNFAPQLEARMFFPRPRNSGLEQGNYAPGNKELYAWSKEEDRWVFYPEIDDPKNPNLKKLKDRIDQGIATIPTDNVGCFLAQARFAALVPGKHDFYFGAERVRQLARFMAHLPADPKGPQNYQPPQMLGANLVIKSSRVDDSPADVVKPRTLVEWKWPDKITPVNFKNGVAVYPWLSIIRVRSGLDLSKHRVYVCRLSGDPEQAIGPEAKNDCRVAEKHQRQESDGIVKYLLPPDPNIAKGKGNHFATLEPRQNYALCLQDSEEQQHCLRFTVHVPFFFYPRLVPSITADYTDPDPYVLLPNSKPQNEIAVFGVVDKNLGERVGALNFSWLNLRDEFKTVVAVEDPGEALRQQLDYFEEKYCLEKGRTFSGLKILLAQMSPETARVFAARFKEKGFEIVVTGADDEQATSETTQTTVWSAANHKGTFVAVPLSGYDDKSYKPRISLGLIEAPYQEQTPAGQRSDVHLTATAQPSELINQTGSPPSVTNEIRQRIEQRVRSCFPNDKKIGTDWDVKSVKLLTLCAIRERTGADVALLQKRDLFDKGFSTVDSPEEFQQALDRIIWKGDLLTLLYVPGSAIRKAMDLSRRFDAEDTNILSLADERGRALTYVGIFFDGEQYFINEMPLDDKRIYAVATSDYIGAGDTGYPDFKAAVLNPTTRASQFPEKLDVISAVVCRSVFAGKTEAEKYCLPLLQRDQYLDTSIAEGPRRTDEPTLAHKLWDLSPFKVPQADSKLPIELREKAQQRPIWTLALRNFSVGFDGLTKNLSDDEVAQKFSGIPTTGITTQKNSSVTAQLDIGLTRTSHANGFFLNFGADFKQRSSGDFAPQILQMKNRGTGDIGLYRSIAGGRSQTRVALALYLHAEAPLQKPFSTFTLSGQDRLRITQNRNFLILPRFGLRWLNIGNSFEAGIQAGREFDAFAGYRFSTNGNIVLCTPSSTETFAACVNRLIKAGVVTKNSVSSAILENRPRVGLYSRINLTIPITGKAKYVFSEEGDLFFNFHGDNSIDTRLRDISKHSLKFNIWPSFSIGPSLQILLYKNKVNGDFLFQRQFGFETTLSFELFNRREKMVQIENKPQVFR